MIQLSGYQADGSPDGRNWASDAGTHTVGAPPGPEADYPNGPGTRSAATRSGFGRARSWVIGIGAGLLALAAIYSSNSFSPAERSSEAPLSPVSTSAG